MVTPTHLPGATLRVALALCMLPTAALAGEQTIYSLPCRPQANEAFAGVIVGRNGDLFGTSFAGGTINVGTVFQLSPPTGGSTNWGSSTLYSFATQTQPPPLTDATSPQAPVLQENNGALLGTGYDSNDLGCGGTGCGAIYVLTRPAGGSSAWGEQAVYDFQGGANGSNPAAGLTAGAHGLFFGTTQYGGSGQAGTVFQLTPPKHAGGAWTEAVLFAFANGPEGGFPVAPLLADASGSLYGTAQSSSIGGGTVFRLSPPAKGDGAWTETTLYTFAVSGAPADGDQPTAGLVADSAGALYGTTLFGGLYGRGTVFRLTPPKHPHGAWKETTLHSFADGTDGALPAGGLLLAADGDLFGTTQGTGNAGSNGTVFRLSPTTHPNSYRERVLYSFSGGSDGQYPLGTLVQNKHGHIFGTTLFGGADRCGAVFEVAP